MLLFVQKRPFLGNPFAQIWANANFLKKTGFVTFLPIGRYRYGCPTSCKILEKTNEPIPGKTVTDERTDGQAWFYRTLSSSVGGPIRVTSHFPKPFPLIFPDFSWFSHIFAWFSPDFPCFSPDFLKFSPVFSQIFPDFIPSFFKRSLHVSHIFSPIFSNFILILTTLLLVMFLILNLH